MRSPDAPEPGGGGPARGARSVTLRGGEQEPLDATPSLDPASKSLADALRVLFRLLQLGLALLAGLYLLSGFQSVREGQSGIRLLFGNIEADRLDPGFRFAFPYPIGELVKVETGARSFRLEDEFWPGLTNASDRDRPVDQLPKNPQLKPELDGSLITADANLVHTRWEVVYSRSKPSAWAKSVQPSNEQAIVSSVVRRSVIDAIAETTIDDLLKQSDGDQGSAASRTRELAQQMLDRMGTGLQIDQLKLVAKMPPLATRDAFQQVQSASESAAKARDSAQQAAQSALSSVAGDAAGLILSEIDKFELAIDKKDAAAADAVLARIDALVEGSPVEIDGKKIENLTSGNVSQLIADAQLYRTSVVNKASSDYAKFQAKLDKFRTNPKLLIHSEWADGLSQFFAHNTVEAFFLPPSSNTLELLLNRDPTIEQEFQRQRALQESQKAEEDRLKKIEEGRHKTETGLKMTPG
jgi:membrane protease subunit HflK